MHTQQLYALGAACLAIAALGCKEERKAQESSSLSAPKNTERVLTGSELANLDLDLQQALQREIGEQVRPEFAKCGEAWGSQHPPGTVFFGEIELRLQSADGTLTVTEATNVRMQESRREESTPLSEAATACVERAFEKLALPPPNAENYRLSVSYPFCIRKPAECPEEVVLSYEKPQMQFAALPNRSERHHPLLSELLEEQGARERRQCRCGLCRVVTPQQSLSDTDKWLVELQEKLRALRSELPAEKLPVLRISNERPIEFPEEPSYTHVYFNFRER